MKAIVQGKFGPAWFVKLKEVEKPVPKANEALVRVMASSLNFADVFQIEGGPWFARPLTMFMKPGCKIPGTDAAGMVEAVGEAMHSLKPGDEVIGNLATCGRGTFAEYTCAPEDMLALKPASLTWEQAGATPQAAGVALQGLRDLGRIQAGMKVAVQGASGGIGTFAVQIARALGAEVTGVCSGRNADLVRSLGAAYVIDYRREDFTRGGEKYDLILAVKGYHPLKAYEGALTPDGRYVMVGGTWRQIFEGGARAHREENRGRVTGLSYRPRKEDWEFIYGLIEAGKVHPVIDRVYPLAQLAAAMKYFDRGRSRGKVAIKVG